MTTMKKVVTMVAVVGALAISGGPAYAGSVKVHIGSNHNKARSVVPIVQHGFVTHVNTNTQICHGYYTTKEFKTWVNGYWDQYWVNTSRWIVNGITPGGLANYVWIQDGYWQTYWVPGYWDVSYQQVWVGDGCRLCRGH